MRSDLSLLDLHARAVPVTRTRCPYRETVESLE
jgi:hypothetical protein